VPPDRLAAPTGVLPLRVLVSAVPVLPDLVLSAWPGLAFQNRDGACIALFPGLIFCRQGGGVDRASVADLLSATIGAGEVRLQEQETPPSDAEIVDHVWEHANRDGSADPRYANNHRIPIVAYGTLQLRNGGEIRRTYLVSNRAAARRFAEAFSVFRAALSDASGSVAMDEHSRDEWLRVAQEPVVRVPPPPRAYPAHEVTAGLALAVGLVAWSAGTPGPLASLPPVLTGLAAPAPPAPSVEQPPRQAEPPIAATPTIPGGQSLQTPAAATPNVVQPDASRLAAPPVGARREQVITRTGANVRGGPAGAADVVRKAQGGTRLYVFARAPGGWVQIGDTAPWGWIHSSLLEAAE
jgi:uncharacterized protein YgiM (DUF1202 family)